MDAPMTAGTTCASPAAREATARDGDDLPLKGFRVLDLGRLFNGPYAGFLLATAGAEVIKVEPPQGDTMRRRARDGDYPFRAMNGCKRGIVLNLKTARGREILLALARHADVLLENYAPSFLPRLGLTPEVFLEANPRLVYASGSGFGRSGPYRDNIALDLNIQAIGGMMSTTGERDGRPLKTGVPVVDFLSGVHLYAGITTALVARERTGRGRVVETSMLEAVFPALLPAAGHVYASKEVPRRTGNRHVADSYVPFDTFETTDGWIAMVCVTDDHWAKLTTAMGRPDLRDDDSLRALLGRVAQIDRVTEAVAQWAATRTRREIVEICQQCSVPATPLRDVQEVLEDPHLHARGFLSPTPTEAGVVSLPNSPIRYGTARLRPLTPAPELGEHTDEVLAQFCGFDASTLAQLRRDGVTR
jgi:crotonobetainyl-CoA:carnitine CoA-transferase CaiB-like acyl-CoA transferase